MGFEWEVVGMTKKWHGRLKFGKNGRISLASVKFEQSNDKLITELLREGSMSVFKEIFHSFCICYSFP